MTLKQLQYFLALSKTCHFSTTADQLFISQSSLSHSISCLEDELQVKLFERHGNRTYLSKYGKAYAEKIAPIFEMLEAANRHLEMMRNPNAGAVSMGVFPGLYKEFNYSMFRTFYAQIPDHMIELKTRGCREADLLRYLETEAMDLILCVAPTSNMACKRLFSQKLLLYVPKNHRLADRESVDLSEIVNENYVMTNKEYSARLQVDDIFRRKGYRYRVVSEQNSIVGAMSLVSNGKGVSIQPHSATNYMFGTKAIEINDDSFQRTVYLAWLKNTPMSNAVTIVRDFLLENGAQIFADSLTLHQQN